MFCYDLNIIIQVSYDFLRVFCFYVFIADCPAGSYMQFPEQNVQLVSPRYLPTFKRSAILYFL